MRELLEYSGFAFVVIVFILEVIKSLYEWNKRGNINHQTGFTMRFVGVVIAYFIEAYFFSYTWSLMAPAFAIGLYAFFDPVMAVVLFGWDKFDHVGNTAVFDRMQQKIIAFIITNIDTIWLIFKLLIGIAIMILSFKLLGN